MKNTVQEDLLTYLARGFTVRQAQVLVKVERCKMIYIPNKKNLQKRRDALGLSRFALSKRAGMGGSALYRIETGITTIVHHLSANAIARALDCKVEDIFTPINRGA